MLEKLHKKYTILLLLVILLLFIFINYLAMSITTLFYPYDADYSEGFILTKSIRLLEGKNVYQDINLPPFSIINYPPIFFLVNSFTMKLFGENLFSARLISFTSSILIGYLIYLIVYKESRNRTISVISSLLFFSSFVTFFISPLARVDVLAALFAVLGIYCMTKYKKRKYLFLAIIFFILSVLTKQTYIAAPVASFFYLLLNDRKMSWKFLIGFILPCILIIILINFLTDGQFLLHLIRYNIGIITFDYNLFNYLFFTNFIVLCLSVYFFKKSKNLFSLYFTFSLIILILQFFRAGGSAYYFFELTIITSILTGFLLNYFRFNPNNQLFLIFIIFLQLILFIQRDTRVLLFIFKPNDYPPLVNLVTDEKISSYAQNSTGNVLVEHATFARINNKEISIEPSSVYELEKNKILGSSEILRFIKSKNCTLIAFYSRFNLIEGLRDYIEKNYRLTDELNWESLESVSWTWKIYKKI